MPYAPTRGVANGKHEHMEQTRAAIAAIHNTVKGKLASIQERAEASTDEETDLALEMEFRNVTDSAVWEALYTLANEIDGLRRSR